MRTVTGEPLKLGRKLCSTMSSGDIGVKFHYRESEDVKFPVISMSEASDKGVIGPKVQYLLCDKEGRKLNKALEELPKTPLLKEKGVYWLEAQGHEVQYPKDIMVAPAPKEEGLKSTCVAPVAKEVRVVEEAADSSPGEVEADPFGDAPLGEDPEPEGEEGRRAKHKKVPPSVSAEVRAERELTHLPFRSWCESCIKGKANEDFHRKREEEKKEDVARFCVDYCFFTKALAQDSATTNFKDLKEERPDSTAVLVCRDQKSGALFAGVANSKGPGDVYSNALALEGMKFCGHPDVLVVSDTEPAIKSVAENLVKNYPKKAVSQPVPKGDPQANGAAERAVLELSNQVRTLKVAFEARYPTIKVTETSTVFPWMVRHAAWLCTRYGVKQDGRTAYERLRNRGYKGEVAECGEVVLYKFSNQNLKKLEDKWACGVWLGKSLSNDEHFVATPNGIQRCRSIRRRVQAKRFEVGYVNNMIGTPWQPRGQPERICLAPGQPLPASRLEGVVPQPRGVYITLERQIKYGRTKGCPGCETAYGEAPKKHSPECRARFEKLLAKEAAPGPRASGSAGEGQDGSFRQPDSRNGGDAPMEVEARSSDAVSPGDCGTRHPGR